MRALSADDILAQKQVIGGTGEREGYTLRSPENIGGWCARGRTGETDKMRQKMPRKRERGRDGLLYTLSSFLSDLAQKFYVFPTYKIKEGGDERKSNMVFLPVAKKNN